MKKFLYLALLPCIINAGSPRYRSTDSPRGESSFHLLPPPSAPRALRALPTIPDKEEVGVVEQEDQDGTRYLHYFRNRPSYQPSDSLGYPNLDRSYSSTSLDSPRSLNSQQSSLPPLSPGGSVCFHRQHSNPQIPRSQISEVVNKPPASLAPADSPTDSDAALVACIVAIKGAFYLLTWGATSKGTGKRGSKKV